jgi:HicB family
VSAPATTSLRLPVDLHEQLANRAVRQGVSLNTLIVTLLAGGIGFKLKKARPTGKVAGTFSEET